MSFHRHLNMYDFEALIKAKQDGKEKQIKIVDLREPYERRKKGALTVPFALHLTSSDLVKMTRMTAKDFSKTYGVEKLKKGDVIMLICEGGDRVESAYGYLREKGFKHVFGVTAPIEQLTFLHQYRVRGDDDDDL
ncbi:Rhodanese-like domain containing protein, putative [Angomonas deanei]|uniref:Rhodanese-like domain containing protein, putative n=1 Tax=Angomonas deanei TaxID=59799 RepID=A0A7G2CNH5_9TRYP|nr:Rhodanese-like domain containing protein, putative [Angomonas deanei]